MMPEMAYLAEAEDVLVFRWQDNVFRLLGGKGRGDGWANIVDVGLGDSPIIERAWRSGVPVRVSSAEPVRVVGPYWSSSAMVVPVGHQHVVVFGGTSASSGPDAAFVSAAARAVAETGEVSAEKLLADEVEVAHAVRALTAYQPTNVRDTALHIATVAAQALSCDVAAVRVRGPERFTLEVLRLDGSQGIDSDPRHVGRDAAPFLDAAATMNEPMVEQIVGPEPQVWAETVVSRMTLPIGPDIDLGALSLGHEIGRERGFTSLCQRIGRALAESAEPLLNQAIAHEQLAAEREQFERATRLDPLTGIGNRAAWEAAIADPPCLSGREQDGRASSNPRYAVLSADLDDLKQINDEHGHAVGDTVLRAAASLLRSTLRATDVLCRVGGDEFLAMLPGAGEREARRVAERVAHEMTTWRVTEHGLRPSLSLGWAVFDGDWQSTVLTADRRMYAEKRRRAAQPVTGNAPKRPAKVARTSTPATRPKVARPTNGAADEGSIAIPS